MEKILYNNNGDPVAYVAMDYDGTIYLWEGFPAAYIFDDVHVYGINGRHLGWFIADILYDPDGERIGFTYTTCPVSISKPPVKGKKFPKDEIRPRWQRPAQPVLSFGVSRRDLADLLKEGRVIWQFDKASTEGSSA
ncbi:MAG: hypothetical protein KKE57_00915 [Proteobacteria bacterium]|nr:hypothetical protein [Pseudomonadota bacterium]